MRLTSKQGETINRNRIVLETSTRNIPKRENKGIQLNIVEAQRELQGQGTHKNPDWLQHLSFSVAVLGPQVFR
jgi:hypothetical protein